MQPDTIKLAFIAEHLLNEGFKSIFQHEAGISVVKEFNQTSLLLRWLETPVDANILIVDGELLGADHAGFIAKVKSAQPDLKVILLSNQTDENMIVKAFRAGISGYLLKSISAQELRFAITHIHDTSQYLCSQLMSKFLDRLLTVPEAKPAKDGVTPHFSGREIEILSLISQGFTNHEIAEKLFTSRRTIENYRQQLIDKTGSKNIVSLVRFAMINGLIA